MRSVLHLFEDFTAARPEVNIQLRSYPDEQLAQACLENEVDLLATCPNTVSGHLDVLVYKPLFTENYQAVMNRSHPLAGEKIISVEQLCTENFCVMDRRINTGLYGDIITMCTKANFAPRVVSESSDMSGLLLNLEMSHGLTILPSSWQKRVLNTTASRSWPSRVPAPSALWPCLEQKKSESCP
jgi:DNA-binding transcriptional LysR family regulator